jgi:putative ABC transport system substrate-binding protein
VTRNPDRDSAELEEDGNVGRCDYGPSLDETFRQRGRQASKLLRGAKPSDLPVELPTTVQLAINLKIAGQLDIVILPALLQRAGEVID